MNGKEAWLYMVSQLQGKMRDQYTNEAIVNAIRAENYWIFKGAIIHKMPTRESNND